MCFTRLRLSSHKLRIETGRWQRLPVEERLCTCGAVQDEIHVLQSCPLTKYLRDKQNFCINADDLLTNIDSLEKFKYMYSVLNFFEK